MSLKMPQKAMVLAAGLGKRLRPLTDDIPKPLLQVAGKPLIDWTLDQLEQADIDDIYINAYYRSEKLRAHVEQRERSRIHFIAEEELMGAGGAIQSTIPQLGPDPFFVLNSNIIWINKGRSAFERLADYWDNDKMDILTLIVDKATLPWFKGKGDFSVEDTDYRLRRLSSGQESPIVGTGIYLIHPRAFKEMPDGAFPLTVVLDEASRNGRLFGLKHQGEWYGITTVHDYQNVNRALTG